MVEENSGALTDKTRANLCLGLEMPVFVLLSLSSDPSCKILGIAGLAFLAELYFIANCNEILDKGAATISALRPRAKTSAKSAQDFHGPR